MQQVSRILQKIRFSGLKSELELPWNAKLWYDHRRVPIPQRVNLLGAIPDIHSLRLG